jgi:4-hydroxy-tetrahydrodipicolinate synthase
MKSLILENKTLKDWPVITALVTPFREGAVDSKALSFLLQKQQDEGCAALVLGSTGEAFSLTADERASVLDLSTNMDLRVPLVVGVTDCSNARVSENIRQANQYNIQAIMTSLPPYYRPGPAGQKEFFKSVLDHSKHPVILYNHPGRAGVAIDPSVVAALADHPKLLTIKHSATDCKLLKALKQQAPTVPIYLGDDALFFDFVSEDVVGLISVMSNAWPGKTKAYVEGCINKVITERLDIFSALEQATNPIPIKTVLSLMYDIHPDVRLPLSLKDLSDRVILEKAIDFMANWTT